MMAHGKVSSVGNLATDHREKKLLTFGGEGIVTQPFLQIIHIWQGNHVIARVDMMNLAGDTA